MTRFRTNWQVMNIHHRIERTSIDLLAFELVN